MFIKGNWSPWQKVHDETHLQEFLTEGGFIKVICITCGVYQPLAELEAGIEAVEASDENA